MDTGLIKIMEQGTGQQSTRAGGESLDTEEKEVLRHQLEALRQQLEVKDRELQIKDQELQAKDQELHMKDQELQIKDQELQAKDQESKYLGHHNEALLHELRAKDEEIDTLLQERAASQQSMDRDEPVSTFCLEEETKVPQLPENLCDPDYHELVWYNLLLAKHYLHLKSLGKLAPQINAHKNELRSRIPGGDKRLLISTSDPLDIVQAFSLWAVAALFYGFDRLASVPPDKFSEYLSGHTKKQRLIKNAKFISKPETKMMLLRNTSWEKKILWHTLILYFYLRPLDLMCNYSIKKYFSLTKPVKRITLDFWPYFDYIVHTKPVQSAFYRLGVDVDWEAVFARVKTHTFFDETPGLHGLCCVEDHVFINIDHIDSFPRVMIILAHEMAHMGKRLKNREAYFNITPQRTEVPAVCCHEDGRFLEALLFGKRVEKLYISAEIFLKTKENWERETEDFIKTFQEIQELSEEKAECFTSLAKYEDDWSSLVCGVSGLPF